MRRIGVRRQVLAGTILFFVLRLALSGFRTGPLLVADEAGYLTNARVLAGGVRGQMSIAPFYRGGYSLLLAPLDSLGLSPSVTYHLILALNALLAASVVPLLYFLLTRAFGIPPQAAVAGAVVGAAYPSVTLLSQVAMSENLLVPLFIAWLAGVAKLADAPSTRARAWWAVSVSACAVALFAVHGRMIVAVALSIVLVAGLAVVRRLAWPALLAALAVVAVGLIAVRALDHFLITTSYGGHAPDEAGSRLSNLQDPAGAASVLRNLGGQFWYMLVATLGLPLVVLSGGSLLERFESFRRGRLAPSLVLASLLASVGGLLVLSSLSFPVPERADMFIYGRYVEVVTPPLLALAVAWLARPTQRPRIAVVLAVLAVATIVAVGLRETFDPARGSNRWDIAALPAPPFQLGASALVLAGVAACFWAVVVVGFARRRPLLVVPTLLVSFAVTTANVERNPLLSGERVVYGSGWTSPGTALRGEAVSYDRSSYDIFGLYVYQWFAPNSRFVLYDASTGPPRTTYLISSGSWSTRHPRIRVRALWRDPNRDQVVYRVLG